MALAGLSQLQLILYAAAELLADSVQRIHLHPLVFPHGSLPAEIISNFIIYKVLCYVPQDQDVQSLPFMFYCGTLKKIAKKSQKKLII